MSEPEVWHTAELAVETPRGRRWRGVSYTPGGRSWRVRRTVNGVGDALPPKAIVRYETRLRVARNEAFEQARGRTIHHNLYHRGDPRGHYPCAEGRPIKVLTA